MLPANDRKQSYEQSAFAWAPEVRSITFKEQSLAMAMYPFSDGVGGCFQLYRALGFIPSTKTGLNQF